MRTMMEALTRSPSSAEARLAIRRMMTSGFDRRRRIWTKPAVLGARAGMLGWVTARSATAPPRVALGVGTAAKKSPEVECRQIAGLVADYLDGILQQRTAELLGRHIDGCHTCVGFVNTYRETIRAIRGL